MQRTYAEDVHCFAISKFAKAQPDSCATLYYESEKQSQTSSF